MAFIKGVEWDGKRPIIISGSNVLAVRYKVACSVPLEVCPSGHWWAVGQICLPTSMRDRADLLAASPRMDGW